MKFSELNTNRLTVRRLRSSDAETVSLYRSAPQVAAYQSAYSVQQAIELINTMDQSDPAVTGKWFQFAIELKSEGRIIGDIGFLNTDENGKSWIGFTLNPEYWHLGYATEAVCIVLDYYSGLGINDVWASTDPNNLTSTKLLTRIGFALVESLPTDLVFRRNCE